MSDKHIHLERRGYSDKEAVRFLFKSYLGRHAVTWFIAGVLTAAVLDITDLHICVGECPVPTHRTTGD